jgi:pyrroline-5-carboxylate reductase
MAPNVVGFIGTGMMANALVVGMCKAGLVEARDVVGTDPYAESRKRFEQTGARLLASNGDVVAASDVVFLSVKPYVVPQVLDEVGSLVSADKVVVSIAAGVTLAAIEARLPPKTRVIRVMPNTPCAVGQSASGVSKGTWASDADMELIVSLFNSVGLAVACPEKDLNAVTGLSGSGPAYIFMVIEALADGGVRAGLTRDTALKLAAQTVKGAACMVLETGQHPGVLKDQVCSPGGTTIAGVHALEEGKLRATLMSAVLQAKLRADELGKL